MRSSISASSVRSLTFRTRPLVPQKRVAVRSSIRCASSSQKDLPVSESNKGPNTDQAPHVSEEQAQIDKTMGETPPDLDQGTPVQEVGSCHNENIDSITKSSQILQRDPEAKKNAPEIVKKEMNQKRAFSTSARRRSPETSLTSSSDALPLEMIYPDGGFGHKFPLPDVSEMPRTMKLRKRYDPVVDQVTKLLMKHGKLSLAQRVCAFPFPCSTKSLLYSHSSTDALLPHRTAHDRHPRHAPPHALPATQPAIPRPRPPPLHHPPRVPPPRPHPLSHRGHRLRRTAHQDPAAARHRRRRRLLAHPCSLGSKTEEADRDNVDLERGGEAEGDQGQ